MHKHCPEVAGCGCAGQQELVCACADANHKLKQRGTVTGRISVKE